MFSLLRSQPDNATLYATLEGRRVRVLLSNAAKRALAARVTPLVAEMELYFSCLIRMRVRFYEADVAPAATTVTDRLSIRFRPVMSQRCDVGEVHGKSPLVDFPIARRSNVVPHWLSMDYKKGEWVGEFGYRPDTE